jgi:hypothetical protein
MDVQVKFTCGAVAGVYATHHIKKFELARGYVAGDAVESAGAWENTHVGLQGQVVGRWNCDTHEAKGDYVLVKFICGKGVNVCVGRECSHIRKMQLAHGFVAGDEIDFLSTFHQGLKRGTLGLLLDLQRRSLQTQTSVCLLSSQMDAQITDAAAPSLKTRLSICRCHKVLLASSAMHVVASGALNAEQPKVT